MDTGNMINPIKSFRENAGLTLEAFGQRVGVQKAAVSKWENGVPPSPACALRIEEATQGVIPKWQLRPDIWTAPEQGHAA